MTEQKEAPGWFNRAIAEPFTDRSVEVDRTSIHYLYWEKGEDAAEKPGIVLVHGNGARRLRQKSAISVICSKHG